MWAPRLTSLVMCCVVASLAATSAQAAQAKDTTCKRVVGVGAPTSAVAWRAGIEARTAVWDSVGAKRANVTRWLARADAPWLLVTARPHAAHGRCFVQVRLPWRPNNATGWVNANELILEKTRWRIAVSTAHRTLTLFRAGTTVRTVSVVVGKPSTPTPTGLFAITWAIPWNPNDFLGSWVLELTAHSDVLQQFDGGDGTVGIHGRGGTSLLDPLGSAASHGCIRLANDTIDSLVSTIGANQLPGTPVQIS